MEICLYQYLHTAVMSVIGILGKIGKSLNLIGNIKTTENPNQDDMWLRDLL